MQKILKNFFAWYKRNYKINLYITAGLLVWQLVHLYWLSVDVVFFRLHGHELWDVGKTGAILISLVDYTEIPALILGSLLYISELKEKFRWKSLLFLIFLNIQWLHLFWITDEIVVEQLTGAAFIALPVWLSWMAILIDYLELPVIYDTVKKSIKSLQKGA